MKRPLPAIVRLMQRVHPQEGPLDSPCWISTYAPNKSGYVIVSEKPGPRILAHRLTYQHFVGTIPVGFVLDHLCRTAACCNPSHVEVVTQGDNIRRGMAPSAIAWRTNTCPRGHSLDDAYIRPAGDRVKRLCRTCRLAGQNRRRASQ